MTVSDRLRAKRPPENDDRWEECKIIELKDEKAVVNNESGHVTLELTEELMDLFKSRRNGDIAWFIKK